MATIKIEINSCQDCPFFKTGNHWSSDGFDRMEDWICDKSRKIIQSSVEWHEAKNINVPDWCEIKTN